MRYLPFIALVVVPLVLWPSAWTFFAVLALGLPVAIELMPPEKPSEFNPAIWHPDDATRAERLAAAMAEWKQRNGLLSWW